MSRTSDSPVRTISQQHWIIGPREDLVLFLGSPLLLVVAFWFAQRFWSLTALSGFATILAMGHYLPGFIRAYGDPALFRRFPLRVTLAPIFLISLTTFLANRESQTLLLVVVAWGAWHWLMQIYGFARIYDAKAKHFDNLSARLDYAFCILWFGVIYWQTDGASAVLMRYYRAGGWLSPQFARGVVWAWAALTCVVSLAYVANLVRCWRAGQAPSVLKLTLMAVSLLFYLYAFGYADNKILAYALFEGFHDIQYLAIVWVFNRRRAQAADSGAFTRFLFQQRTALVVLYVFLCLGFGSYDYFARSIQEEQFSRMALGVITGLALVHFYFDGFIWRMREPETRSTLGVEQGSVALLRRRLTPVVRHALLWVALLVPLSILGWTEVSANPMSEAEACQAVLEVRPQSHKAHFLLSTLLPDSGQDALALEHARAALKLRSDYDLYETRFADLMLVRADLSPDDLDLVIECYAKAAKTQRHEFGVYSNWALALARRGRFDEAAFRYSQALQLDSKNAELHFNRARCLMQMGNFIESRQALLDAVANDPDHGQAYLLLASLYGMQGQFADALQAFQRALEITPDSLATLASFAEALLTMPNEQLRDFSKCQELLERAARIASAPDEKNKVAMLCRQLSQELKKKSDHANSERIAEIAEALSR
ncbi:MAG: tetratricopeptide repeat protein [Pirellulaceae bacterium]